MVLEVQVEISYRVYFQIAIWKYVLHLANLTNICGQYMSASHVNEAHAQGNAKSYSMVSPLAYHTYGKLGRFISQ